MSSAPQAMPDAQGRFGPYGGRYVPETLVAPLEELEQAYAEARERSEISIGARFASYVISRGVQRRFNLLRASASILAGLGFT